ncbi:hypothetical protein SeMB42_g01191 [Synchytrium endobioticum]|nr:hypothetical protein SeMB42_g01191 [Synchytrium endobioticum]
MAKYMRLEDYSSLEKLDDIVTKAVAVPEASDPIGHNEESIEGVVPAMITCTEEVMRQLWMVSFNVDMDVIRCMRLPIIVFIVMESFNHVKRAWLEPGIYTEPSASNPLNVITNLYKPIQFARNSQNVQGTTQFDDLTFTFIRGNQRLPVTMIGQVVRRVTENAEMLCVELLGDDVTRISLPWLRSKSVMDNPNMKNQGKGLATAPELYREDDEYNLDRIRNSVSRT